MAVNQNRIERHHTIPLSLGGCDVIENILSLKHKDHRLIHDTLDIPYNTVRKYRTVMNQDMFSPTVKMAKAQARIESLFFARFEFLPERLQKCIYETVFDDTERMYIKYNVKMKNVADGSYNEQMQQILLLRKNLYIHLVNNR